MDVIEELKSFWEKSQKKNSGGGGSVWGVGLEGQHVNKELKFFENFFLGGGSGGEVGGGLGGGVGLGGQGGCERRTEVFVKIPKKNYFFFGVGGVGLGGGSGWM